MWVVAAVGQGSPLGPIIDICPMCHFLIADGRSANRLYPEVDSQAGHICDEINVENLAMVIG